MNRKNMASSPLRSPEKNTMLECRVCQDSFGTEGAKLPRLLQCGHTVCQGCLLGLEQQQGSVSGTGSHPSRLFCPFDRLPTPLTHDCGILGLKRNFALVELLEKLALEASERQQAANLTSSSSAACGGESTSTAGSTSESAVEGGGRGDKYARDRRMGIPCDEDNGHVAVLYCTVCESHLCEKCLEETHKARILSKHRCVPVSEKPEPKLKCQYHSAYGLEFVCKEVDCECGSKLMCLLCRDYGRHSGHRHGLLETEAEGLRKEMSGALLIFNAFVSQLTQWAPKLDCTIRAIRGSITNGVGSGETARSMVRQHFAELREQLSLQEAAALTVLETHIRERLGILAQQQEDLATATTQVSAVCVQLEKSLKMDDARVVLQSNELNQLMEAVEKQRIQLTNFPAQLNLDSRIPVAFTKDNRVHIGPKVEMRVVALGLDNAGKTTILFKLKQNELVSAVSTIGFNVETLDYKNLKLTLWDVGGLPKLRPLWKHYYLNTQGIIFVIDSKDSDRLAEVQSELVHLLSENHLRDAALLVLANKQDLGGSLSGDQLIQILTLNKLCYGRSWHLQPCDALSGAGLWEGMDWLARQLISNTLPSTSSSTTAAPGTSASSNPRTADAAGSSTAATPTSSSVNTTTEIVSAAATAEPSSSTATTTVRRSSTAAISSSTGGASGTS